LRNTHLNSFLRSISGCRPDIVTREKKIESQGHGVPVGRASMQGLEIGNAIRRQVNNLGVNDQWRTESPRFLDDTGISLRPIISVHRVETHAAIADVDL
jgi:hypothetical protein